MSDKIKNRNKGKKMIAWLLAMALLCPNRLPVSAEALYNEDTISQEIVPQAAEIQETGSSSEVPEENIPSDQAMSASAEITETVSENPEASKTDPQTSEDPSGINYDTEISEKDPSETDPDSEIPTDEYSGMDTDPEIPTDKSTGMNSDPELPAEEPEEEPQEDPDAADDLEELLSDGSVLEEDLLTSELPEAGSTASSVPYIGEDGQPAAAASCTVVEEDVITWNDGWYVVYGNITISSRVKVKKKVHLILADGASLRVPKGIEINRSSVNELHIYAQSEGTGVLTAGGSCSSGNSGIGGSSGMAGGSIYISGGTIYAEGGTYGAGIGGGLFSDGTLICILEGDVTAKGGSQAAGIGGGYQGGCEELSISGGSITAIAGETAASYEKAAEAIGSGQDPQAASGRINFILYDGAELHAGTDAQHTTVYLNDSQGIRACRENPYVRITRSEEGVRFINKEGDEWLLSKNLYQPIKNGMNSWSNAWYLVNGAVTIPDRATVSGNVSIILGDGAELNAEKGITVAENSSLTIYGQQEQTGVLRADASGKDGSAGIGSENGGNAGTIEIYGGNVTALGGKGAPGIGSSAGDPGIVLIGRGVVNATGGTDGAGIGGCAVVEIQGGTITAVGKAGGAGLGGNAFQSGGPIRIIDGELTATGGDNGAGIGAGNHASGDDVTIIQGKITATGGTYAAGIGGGYDGDGGSVSITGGIVTAKGGSNGIGGGTDGETGSVYLYGGTVLAQGSRGCAVGGSTPDPEKIVLGEILISAGNDETSLQPVYVLPRQDTRKDALKNHCARIEYCSEHEEAEGYMFDKNGHCHVCSRCAKQMKAEKHEYMTYDPKPDDPEESYTFTPKDEDYHTRECKICHYVQESFHEYNDNDSVSCSLCGGGMISLRYMDVNGNIITRRGCRLIHEAKGISGEVYELNDESYNGFYLVRGTVTIQNRIQVEGKVNIVLSDNARMTAVRGVHVAEGSSLTIWGQDHGDGSLTAGDTASLSQINGMAGIGGDSCENGGNIVINGGFIYANGGEGASGIGSGSFEDDPASVIYINHFAWTETKLPFYKTGAVGGSVTINAGNVRAVGGNNAAAIGGGASCPGGNITINGGLVFATGKGRGAGIGGGEYAHGGNIVISGGQVEVTASGTGVWEWKNLPMTKTNDGHGRENNRFQIMECGAAIGGGSEGYQDMTGAFTRITITTGAKVKAHAIGNAAAIGQGFAAEGNMIDSVINITGGQISAISDGGCPVGTFETNGCDWNNPPTRKCKTTLSWTSYSDYLDLHGKDHYGRVKLQQGNGANDSFYEYYNLIVLENAFRDKNTGEIFSKETGNKRKETSAWTILNRTLIPADVCIVSFDGNGTSFADHMEDDIAVIGRNYTIPASTFWAPRGKYFIGWKVSWNDRIMNSGDSLFIDQTNGRKNLTLTAQWGDSYNVWVGNVLVTEHNYQDILGDGKVSYDPKKKILRLDHVKGIKMQTPIDKSNLFSNQETDLALIGAKDQNLIIEFDDTSLVSEDKVSYGIAVVDGSLVIRPAAGASSRTLTVESKYIGIHADQNLTIQDVTDLQVVSVTRCGLRAGKDITLKKNSLQGTDRLRYKIRSYSAIEAGGDILISDIALLEAEATSEHYGCSIKGKNVRIARNSSYTAVNAFGGTAGISASQEVSIEDSYVTLSGLYDGMEARNTVIKGQNTSCSVTAEGSSGITSPDLTIENAVVEGIGTQNYGISAYKNLRFIWSDPEKSRMRVYAKCAGNTQVINFTNIEIGDKLMISVPKGGYINTIGGHSIRSADGGSVTEVVISPKEFEVSFDPNGGSGEMAPRSVGYADEYSLPACSFQPPSREKEFLGWMVGDQFYKEDEIIEIYNDETAVAQWGEMTWEGLQKRLRKGGTIVLYNDVKADGSKDDCLISDRDAVIDLNGHNIDRDRDANTEKDRSVIRIIGGNLSIRDSAGGGRITGGNGKTNGGGIYVAHGRLTLEGGTITGNRTPYYGAGVYVEHGSFTMTGGEISGNESYMTGSAVFVMNSDAAFHMTGGRITGNSGLFGAAVNCHEGSFSVSGSPVITGNRREMGQAATGYDLTSTGYYLPSAYHPIHVTGPLTKEARIEVSSSDTSHMVITEGLSENGTVDAFISENGNYGVRLNSAGEAVLVKVKKITFYADPAGKKILLEDKLEPGVSLSVYADLSEDLEGADFERWVCRIPGSGNTEFQDADLSVMKMPDSDIAFYPVVKGVLPWVSLQEQLKQGGTIVLSQDVAARPSDTCLIIEKDTVIDLKGCTIDRNRDSAVQDGMVFKVKGGNLTILDSVGGGKITGGDTTGNGGAILIEHGSVTMTGGEISGNKAAGTGSAVFMENSDASFTMTGGQISGNNSKDEGAVSADNAESIFAVSGTPVITGNTVRSGSAGAGFVVNANGSSPIRILGPLSQNAKIEVTARSRIPAVVTAGLPDNGNAGVFVSADSRYGIRTDETGEAELGYLRTITFYSEASVNRSKIVSREKLVVGESLARFDGLTVEKKGYRFYCWYYYPPRAYSMEMVVLSTMKMPDYDLDVYPFFFENEDSTNGYGSSYNTASTYSTYSSAASYSSGSGRTASATDEDSDDSGSDASENTEKSFVKVLSSVNDMNVLKKDDTKIIKARYGEEDDATAAGIYVLEKEVPLGEDIRLDQDRLKKYHLWNNMMTQQDVYLLPNAARLYTTQKPDYVSDTIRGDVKGDGGEYDIDIITALNKWAVSNPQIPVGSAGSLDFAAGILMLPSLVDYELFLHEISASWIVELLDKGMIRMLSTDQDDIDRYVLNGEKKEDKSVPSGEILEGLIEDDEASGRIVHPEEDENNIRKGYWLGATPETSSDKDQTLIFLLVNEDTDEIDAFRTSVSMLDAGEEGIDVSLYLYRDSKSDRRGEEKYNVMFFDTPEGEKSLLKVITNVLEDRTLELPKTLNIGLRSFDLGADLPSYSLSDHFFALNDGTPEETDASDNMEEAGDADDSDTVEETAGRVSMFDGFYQAVFDGDVFESSYTRIEGIEEGDLTVTLSSGQDIWPEWTGEDSAEDIQKNRYERSDGVWELVEEESEDHSDEEER